MRSQRGAATLEMVLLTPVLLLLLLFVVLGGRLAQARADVDAAARDAARAASIARSPAAARSDGAAAATSHLADRGVSCRALDVSIDAGAFAPGGTVTAVVACTVDLGDLTGLRVPLSRSVSSSFSEAVDLYRGAGS